MTKREVLDRSFRDFGKGVDTLVHVYIKWRKVTDWPGGE